MSEQLELLPPDACTAQHHTTQQRQPYGIHGNKFPGVIWPDPKKMQFDIARDYDPMAMGNREKPLNLSSYRESPRRTRKDLREAED